MRPQLPATIRDRGSRAGGQPRQRGARRASGRRTRPWMASTGKRASPLFNKVACSTEPPATRAPVGFTRTVEHVPAHSLCCYWCIGALRVAWRAGTRSCTQSHVQRSSGRSHTLTGMAHHHDFTAGDLHPPTAEELSSRARAHAAAVLRNYHAQPRIGKGACCLGPSLLDALLTPARQSTAP